MSSGAKGRTGIFTTEQQENIKKFRKFIGSLDGGFTAQAQRNITSTPIDDIADGLFSQEDVGKNIKKQFKNFLRLDSYMSSDPLIIYKLYKLNDSIGSNTSYSTFLKLEAETKKLYIYKFSVNYKCAIVEDVLYYQKNVDILNFYKENKADDVSKHNYPNLVIKKNILDALEAQEAQEALNPPPSESDGERAADDVAALPALPAIAALDAVNAAPAGNALAVNAAAPADGDAPGAGQPGSVGGSGGNRKIKRKELNKMSLNELKQLHRNNGIKMNSNKTVNALINNYIKHH